jgi:hypothetical protein
MSKWIDSDSEMGVKGVQIEPPAYLKYKFSNMSTLVESDSDDHTEMGVKGAQNAGGSMHDSESQLDDDCASEDSLGSSFGDNAMDEENTAADIELDSSPPVYSDEEYPQSDDMYVKSPSMDPTVVPLYTPRTRSTQPAFSGFSGPSMCVVRGLIFSPAMISIN